MCENCFLIVFFEVWRSNDLVVLKFERCKSRDDTYIVEGAEEDVRC